MSDALNKAAEALAARFATAGSFDGCIKFDVADEGSILVDGTQSPPSVRVADGEADCTLRASLDTFEALFNGDMNPTMAFMTGKLKIDGSMGLAMKLASILG